MKRTHFINLINLVSLCCLSVCTFSNAFGVTLPPDAIVELQDSKSREISADLQSTFGEDRKFLVQVWALPVNEVVKQKDSVLEPDAVVDLGYMTYPFSTKTTASQSSAPASIGYKFNVAVKTSGPLNAKDKKLIEETVRFATAGLNPQITVTQGVFKVPEKKLEREPTNEKNKASDHPSENKPDAPTPQPEGVMKWLNQILFGGLIIALVFTALLLRSGFVGASQNLSGGIQSLRNIRIDQKAQPEEKDQEGVSDSKEKPSVIVAENNVDDVLKSDAGRLITLIKESLQKRPRSILSLSADPQNQVGIRWLLTQMNEAEVQLLQSVLGPDYFDKLLQIPREKILEANLKSWLRGFSESLILVNLKEPGLIEEALDPVEMAQLLSVKPQQIFSQLQSELTPAIFRILAEITPEKEFTELSGQFSEDQWVRMFKARSTGVEDIKNAAKFIHSKFRNEDPNNQSSAIKKSQILQRKLYLSLIPKLYKLPPQEEERFLDQIKTNYPVLYRDLRNEIWFVEDLNLVPENHLKASILEKGTEEIFALTLGLPKPWPDKIKDFLPEGTKKIVILDLVQKASARTSDDEMKAVYKVCRQFIAQLKNQADKGKFKLATRKVS